MGRKRKAIITGDFEPLDLVRVGMVTMGTKPYFVEQHDDHRPPYAEITSSRHIDRQPRPLTRRGTKKPEFLSDRFPQHRWQKYCSGGHWVDRWYFSEDKSRKDGLRYYCDACVARMEKQRYWSAKQVEQQAA